MGFLSNISRLFRKRNLDCKDVRELSSEYLEKELSPSLFKKIQEHLDECNDCFAFVKTLSATIDLLNELPKTNADPRLKASIQQFLRQYGSGEN